MNVLPKTFSYELHIYDKCTQPNTKYKVGPQMLSWINYVLVNTLISLWNL